MKKKPILYLLVLSLLSINVIADLDYDVYIYSDGNINFNANLYPENISELKITKNTYYTENNYRTGNSYKDEDMLKKLTELINGYVGIKKELRLSSYEEAFLSALTQMIYRIYENIYEYYIIPNQLHERANSYAIIELEKDYKSGQSKEMSALCRGWLRVMEEEGMNSVTCENNGEVQTWHNNPQDIFVSFD